uniref:S-formylglutathione hydrolase n=2 Tax=Amphimedon queenslandica TaxID=400682 RepID=A0A1X7VCP2_AMPQE
MEENIARGLFDEHAHRVSQPMCGSKPPCGCGSLGKNNMAASQVTEVSKAKSFGGWQKVFQHHSDVLKCDMKFAIYLPQESETKKVPVIYYLSGLTCTEQNVIAKSGFQRYASEAGVAIVAPDTSPRGCNIEGEDDSYDFGSGAGFYINATTEKWKENYNMYSYVTKELPAAIETNFNIEPSRKSIFGHSMGGHGALICYLKNPGSYISVSAFAPICNPSNCPWGKKAFTGYLGPDEETWKEWDATELVKSYKGPNLGYILIDQGADDNFLKEKQLLPEAFVDACRVSNVPVVLQMQEGYDHSYYFVSTFIGGQIQHHAKLLKQ